MSFVAIGGTVTLGAATGAGAAMIGGAAVGAGVGSIGHDHWGWNKDAIWQGAAIGGVGGWAAGAGAGGTAAGTGTGTGTTAGVGGEMWGGLGLSSSQLQAAGTAVGVTPSAAAGTGLMASLTKPMIPSLAFSSPLQMGAAGLALMSGGSSQGSSFQDKIKFSKEGKQLHSDYLTAAKAKMAKAQKGNVSDHIFQQMSDLKSAESVRSRAAERSINTASATIGNNPKEGLGMGTMGGNMTKALLANSGERMEGLFAPSSLLKNARREELVNASKQLQNLSNLDNQTAAFNYNSSLAKWSANESLGREKGAAIGSAVAMIGSSQLGRSYRTQMKIS